MKPFWVLQAGRLIESAEKKLGKLSRGWKINLLLDNIPDLAGKAEATQLLKEVESTYPSCLGTGL